MVNRLRNLFAKQATGTRPKAVTRQLLEPLAVDELLEALTSMPDPDTVLAQAGLSRADLRKLEGDDEISAALETRLSAVLSTPWRIEPGDGAITEFVYSQLEPRLSDLVSSIWHAVPYGYSVVEATYARAGDRYVWASLDERPFEWFKPQPDGSLKYFPRDGRAGLEGDLVDTTWKFFLARRKATYRNPYGEALLSRLYWPWKMRTDGWRFWARFLERHGAPLLVGKTPGSPAEMAQAMAAAVQSAVIAVGPDDDVTAVTPGNAGDAFDRFDRAVDKRIQKVILGQTLTSDIDKGGSFAAAKVQDEVRDDRRKNDLRLVVPVVQRLVDALVTLNFPAAEVPTFVMEDSSGIETERATRDAELAKAGIVKFTEQYLLDRYDFEPGDFEIPKATAPVAVQAAARGPHQFAASTAPRFTRQQQAIEALGEGAMELAGPPIDPQAIRTAIFAAADPEDLAERLAVLLRDDTSEAFQQVLERALFAADVIGYVHAEGKA